MIFNSVAEVFDSLEQTRSRLYDSIQALSEDQARFRPAPEQWSVADIAEHLSIFESLILKLISGLIEQGERSAPVVDDGAIAPISVERIAAHLTGKLQAPEILLPTGDVSLERSIEKLRQSRGGLLALRKRLESRDFTQVTFSRGTLGPLNPYQWLAFVGYHENRHLDQINALISSESFPARRLATA
ncbi:MAG TPA: DinB family protein [Blastocatellia bacterium]|jgi:hypothetical protein